MTGPDGSSGGFHIPDEFIDELIESRIANPPRDVAELLAEAIGAAEAQRAEFEKMAKPEGATQ